MAEVPPGEAVPDGYEFALCLTHDVDRPYKTYQALYYALTERDPSHLASLLPGRNPYWQFDSLMALEDDLGVRSAFYFLDEQHLFRDRPVHDWLDPANWMRYLGRYRLDDPAIRAVARALERGGWEVGLHGSFESYHDPGRIRAEKAAVEGMVESSVLGGRQHYLNLDVPDTWRYQADAGLRYDASLGDADSVGFRYGHGLRRPFDDEFVVFPLTAMELALPDPGTDFEAAWSVLADLLAEASEHGAVMTVLWHPRMFAEGEFPGHRRLYRRLVEEAQSAGGWVGPPADVYRRLDHPDGRRSPGAPGESEGEATATDERRSRTLTKVDRREVPTE